MRRREFMVSLLGGMAAARPVTAGALEQAVPVVGILASVAADPYVPFLLAIKEGLREQGYVEGKNIAFEYRWAEGRYEELPAHAADLVRMGVAAIVLMGGRPPLNAAKAATTAIPIVFTIGEDPVKAGAVAAINHPGGNITGVSLLSVLTEAKRLQLLHELLPHAADVGVIVNPDNPQSDEQMANLQSAAESLGLRVRLFKTASAAEIDQAFAALAQQRPDALIVAADAFFNTRARQLVTLADRNAIPAMYTYRQFAVLGGLVSYGPDIASAYRAAGNYTGRILRGEKPADLPVQQVEKFDFVINLKTAKALGLAVPPNLLAFANEVIE
jgi:putative ABC transport system substrate-binding protein